MRKVNVFAPAFDSASDRDGFRWRSTEVGPAVGASQIGVRLIELPDGERAFPYRFHHVAEEWLVVVSGTPVVRSPAGERGLRAGDVICFAPGPDGAYQVRGPGTIMILAERHVADTIEYPDSGKVELVPSGEVFRRADAVGYWEGE